MDIKLYQSILYAVGSLPFWTGERKLKMLLQGTPGSFWEPHPPLKPIYLNHYFYGRLRDRSSSELNRALQSLKSSEYLVRERLKPDRPHRVLKFTDRGVRKYYNLLVLEREMKQPIWMIHHVSRLEQAPRSPFHTGGEIMEFSGKRYLTQSPGFLEPEARVRDDSTLSLREPPEDAQPGTAVLLHELTLHTDRGHGLQFLPRTTMERVSQADLREALTHFPPREAEPGEENPYVLEGTLVHKERAGGTRDWRLEFEREDRSVSLYIQESDLSDEVGLETGRTYLFGPVKRHPSPVENREHHQLILNSGGSVRPSEDRYHT